MGDFGEYFDLREFTRSITGTLQGLDNSLPAESLPGGLALVETVLDPLRREMGPILVASGYRSPVVNAAVGGVRTSQHVWTHTHAAADIRPLGPVTLRECFLWLVGFVKFDQLIWEAGQWLHVSHSRILNRREVLTMQRVGGKAVYAQWKHSEALTGL